MSEVLTLCEALGFCLASAGPLTLSKCLDGPADRCECGLVLAWYGRRVDRQTPGPQHRAHRVITDPLSHGSRKTPHLGIDGLVSGDIAPQNRSHFLVLGGREHGDRRFGTSARVESFGIGVASALRW